VPAGTETVGAVYHESGRDGLPPFLAFLEESQGHAKLEADGDNCNIFLRNQRRKLLLSVTGDQFHAMRKWTAAERELIRRFSRDQANRGGYLHIPNAEHLLRTWGVRG